MGEGEERKLITGKYTGTLRFICPGQNDTDGFLLFPCFCILVFLSLLFCILFYYLCFDKKTPICYIGLWKINFSSNKK